ncbi:MAG: type III secretion fhipep protein [Gemmatimonadaceae bacterium]
MQPAAFCRQLLATIDASDGRRRRRKRDTTPDAIGLAIKRRLLQQAVADDPASAAFEHWLFERSLDVRWLRGGNEALESEAPSGAVQAMAASVLAEWRLVRESPAFHDWLAQGAPSEDAG